MVCIDRRAIVFILIFFISSFAFLQDKQSPPMMKLREEILEVYQTKGESGLRDFFQINKKQITKKFILDFAEAGLKERKEEWLKACEFLAVEKEDEKTLAEVYLNIGQFFLRSSDFERANHFYDKAIPICERVNFIVGLGISYQNKGFSALYSGKNVKAIEMFEKALQLYKKSQDNQGQGNVYLGKSQLYLHTGYYEKALETIEKSLHFFKKSGDNFSLGNIFKIKGDIYCYSGENYKAIEMYKKAFNYYKEENENNSCGNIYCSLGKIHARTGNYFKAIKMYKNAINCYNKAGSLIAFGNLYKGIGNLYLKMCKYAKADEFYEKALSYYQKAREPRGQGNIYISKGDIYLHTGINSKAIAMFEIAFAFFKKSGDIIGLGNVYYRKGDIYKFSGDNIKAFKMYEKAIEIFKKARYQIGLNISYLRKGEIFLRSGNYSKANELYNIALLFFKKEGDPLALGDIYHRKGLISFLLKKYTLALDMFDKSLVFFKKAESPSGIGTIYCGQGDTYLKIGLIPKSLVMYKKALINQNRANTTISTSNSYTGLGNIHFEKKEYLKAIEMYDKAIKNSNRFNDLYGEIIAFHKKANVLDKQGKYHEALVYFEKSIAELEKIRGHTVNSNNQILFLEEIYNQYEKTALFMLKNKYDEKSFKYAESMRARVFLDQMAEGLVKLEKGLKPGLKEDRDRLVGKLSALSRRMQETGRKDEKKLQKLKEKYQKVESEFDDLLIKIRLENPLYTSVNYPQPVTARDLQKEVLKPGETLLSYFIAPETAYAFIVSKKKFKVKQLAVNEKEVNSYVQRYLQAIEDANNKDMMRYGSLLYEKLVKPMEKNLQQSKELIIVPAGQLERIPFESLIVSNKNPGRPVFLLEKHRLKYVQGATLLSILRKYFNGKSSASGFIGFGDPVYENVGSQWPVASGQSQVMAFVQRMKEWNDGMLEYWNVSGAPFGQMLNMTTALAYTLMPIAYCLMPNTYCLFASPFTNDQSLEEEIKEILQDRYARGGGVLARLPKSGEEVKAIAGIFAKESLKNVVYLREQATEENAKSPDMKDFAYIHFSCHGLLNDDFQSLVLSQLPTGKSKEDGYFTLNEIMNCDYNAQLVVLSACETGSGKMYRGEGVSGLTRAVMYAGTPAVIASLWKVDDRATKELMVLFYQNLLEQKMDKAEALRQAKLKLLEKPEYASPLYWSGFVLYGE